MRWAQAPTVVSDAKAAPILTFRHPHSFALDISFSAALLLVLVSRLRLALLPLLATWLDCAVTIGLIGAPPTATQWGVSAVTLGFALLTLSLLGNWWWQRRANFRPEPRRR